ncbi:dihydropteroate synthase, partial [Salmonella enterica]|uniref:dihydropteroate synthase n=1 Tax=Salmonella enterica TaxID=28901 RepID=UPI0020C23D82
LPVSLMDMQGIPKTMQDAANYDDVFAVLNRYFFVHIARFEKAGIANEKLLLYHVFGLVKNLSQNYTFLSRLCEFHLFN